MPLRKGLYFRNRLSKCSVIWLTGVSKAVITCLHHWMFPFWAMFTESPQTSPIYSPSPWTPTLRNSPCILLCIWKLQGSPVSFPCHLDQGSTGSLGWLWPWLTLSSVSHLFWALSWSLTTCICCVFGPEMGGQIPGLISRLSQCNSVPWWSLHTRCPFCFPNCAITLSFVRASD